ncbi:MAG: hypothetical protein IPJ30_10070 [Acidobacteria bacterium]|nr:hypothetical protein [Acidobacteriota bacterium]
MTKVIRTRFGKNLLIFSSFVLGHALCIGFLDVQKQVVSPPVREIQTDDESRIFIKDEGWPIPNSGLVKDTSFGKTIRVQGERKVKLKVTIYDFSNELVSDEPLRTLGYANSKIRYTELYVYRIKGNIFCYKLLYSYVSMGLDNFLAFYDEDGDGVFESLVLDETVNGVYSSSNPPHIPPWSLNKKSKKN